MKEKSDDGFLEENNNDENQEFTEVKREITTEIETYRVKVKDDNQYLNTIKKKNKLAILNNQGNVIEILKLPTFEKIMHYAGENISDNFDRIISFTIYSNEEIKIYEGFENQENPEKNEIDENIKNEDNTKLKAKKPELEKKDVVANRLDILKKIIEERKKEKEKEEEKYSSEDKFVIFASLAGLIVYLSKFISR